MGILVASAIEAKSQGAADELAGPRPLLLIELSLRRFEATIRRGLIATRKM